MLKLLPLYMALTLGATAAMADLSQLRVGDMRKMVVHAAPLPLPDANYATGAGEAALGALRGPALVNFWATWCAPCRHEMPAILALGDAHPDLTVELIATGPNNPAAIEAFFDEIGRPGDVSYAADPRQRLARAMGVIGLPVTVLIDAQGREVARVQGDADWDAPEAHAVIAALLDEERP
ncbi:MAG: TlpA family protein disulfide reductase [Paracoccaceae bacterium]